MQGVDISFTVCGLFVFCVCPVTDFSAEDKAASNFARRFIGVRGRESPIFGIFAPHKPKIGRIGASLACRPKVTEVRAAGESTARALNYK